MSAGNSSNYIYGLDIGGTKIEIAIFTDQLYQLDSWRTATPTIDYEQFIATVVALVAQAEQKYANPLSIGIGMPGITDGEGRVTAANIPCACGKKVESDLTQALGRDIVIENDCHLFALSEANGGAGSGERIVYGAIMGTGAAGGVCIEGKLLRSRQNIIGEYGHMPAPAAVVDNYQLPIYDCGCGLRGCYETYIAGPGLGRLYQYFGSGSTDTRTFVAQLEKGDSIANKTFVCYMDLLGASFASLILSYDPDVIVVGGGLSKIAIIIEALPAAVAQHLFAGVKVPPIRLAEFGDASGVRGAAILGQQHNKG